MNEVINKVVELNLNDVLPNRYQPRIQFNDQDIIELSESIKEHGVIQPIVVRPLGNKYEIIAGERRYKASVFAGKQKIPALITNINDKQTVEFALIENIQRKDLTPIEEAISYKRILDMGHITQEQLATKIGKSQPSIANKIRLLNLSDEVQEALLKNEISERHARSLLKLQTTKDQNEMLTKIINERLTVKRTDEEIDKMNTNNEFNNTNNNQMNTFNGVTTPQPPAGPNQTNENIFGPVNTNQLPPIAGTELSIPTSPILEDGNNNISTTPEPPVVNEINNFVPGFENGISPQPQQPIIEPITNPQTETQGIFQPEFNSDSSNDMEMISIGSLFNNQFSQPVENNIVTPAETGLNNVEQPNVEPTFTNENLFMTMNNEQTAQDQNNNTDSIPTMFNFNQIPEMNSEAQQPTFGLKDLVVNNESQPSLENNNQIAPEPEAINNNISESINSNINVNTPIVDNNQFSQSPFMFNNENNNILQPMNEVNSFEVEAPVNPMDAMPQTPIMPPIPEEIPSTPIIDNSSVQMEQPTIPQQVSTTPVTEQPTVQEKIPEPIIITDYNKQYDPVMPQENQPQQPTITFKQVIDLIRECSKSIEQYGYKIDTDEFDLQDSYQVIFKIDKD